MKRAASCVKPGLIALLIGACVSSATSGQSLPDGFALETVVGGPFIGYPVGFTFLPDGRPLIIEKETGNVRVAAVGSNTSVVFGTLTGIQGDAERGLLGIAVDPAWPERPYLYFMGTYVDGRSHVTMHEVSGDLTDPASTSLRLGDPYLLLDYILNIFPNHKAGTVRFAATMATSARWKT
jgi:glucose/arabinose dehydrogenase